MIKLTRYSIFFIFSFFFIYGISSSENDPIIYITKTGSKYHTAGCSSLGKSSIPIKLSEVSTRYTPCSRCKPPVLKTMNIDIIDSKSALKPSVIDTTKKGIINLSKQTNIEKEVGTTSSGEKIYEGPRGGKYYYNKNGKKVYVGKSK
jgi:hypothetical protein